MDWSFARLMAPVVTTTSINLSSNKIQNGDILVPANPGPEAVKTERETHTQVQESAISRGVVQLSGKSRYLRTLDVDRVTTSGVVISHVTGTGRSSS